MRRVGHSEGLRFGCEPSGAVVVVAQTFKSTSKSAVSAFVPPKRSRRDTAQQVEQPPKLDVESAYLPRSGTAVQVFRLSFTFAEVLPEYLG